MDFLIGAPIAFSLFAEFVPNATRGKALILIEIFWSIGTLTEAALAWLVVTRKDLFHDLEFVGL